MKKVIVLLMSLFLLTGCLEEEKLDKIAYTTYYPLEFATNYMYKDFATVKSIYPNGIDTSKYTLTDKQKSIYASSDMFVYAGVTDEVKLAAEFLNTNQNISIIDGTKGLSYSSEVCELWLDPSNYLMIARNIKSTLIDYANNVYDEEKIDKLYDGKDIISGSSILREGESYYSWWAREWAGVDPQTGEEQWVLNTQNKDGSLNKELTKNPGEAQRIIIGTPDPKLTGGWRNSLSWKGLEFNALFSFSLGGKLLDDACLTYTDTDGENAYYAIGKQQLNRWQKPGDITDVPRRINNYTYARYSSDRHMHTNNYLRLKSVSLSYSLPKQWLNPLNINNLRVFVSGSNLLTFQSYDNVDPEQPINGNVNFAFPAMKSVSFGTGTITITYKHRNNYET